MISEFDRQLQNIKKLHYQEMKEQRQTITHEIRLRIELNGGDERDIVPNIEDYLTELEELDK